MELVTSLKVCSQKVRADCGTEKVLLAAVQCFLRRNHTDELSSSRKALLWNFSTESKNISLVVAIEA